MLEIKKGLSLNIRLTKTLRSITYFPKTILSQLIGHLLGDGCLVMGKTSITPYFVFTQSLKKFHYLWDVFSKLGPFCGKLPLFNVSLSKNKIYPFLQVITRSYPKMLNLYQLFYTNINGKMVKIIKRYLLNYLDEIVLAYWAMDYGAATTQLSGFYLHTKGYTFQEVYLLAGMLHYRFGLVCTVQSHEKRPVLNITSKSMPLFISLVLPHFRSSMIYKLEKYKQI